MKGLKIGVLALSLVLVLAAVGLGENTKMSPAKYA